MRVIIPSIETELREVKKGLHRLQGRVPSGNEFAKKEFHKLVTRLDVLERKLLTLKKQHA